MKKGTVTLERWFKLKVPENSESNASLPDSNVETLITESPSKIQRTEDNGVLIDSLVRDPGDRRQIWEYPFNQRDDVRRAYIKFGPYQPKLDYYKPKGKRNRKFQYSWFALFPSWLEYSQSIHRAFCLPCFLFNKPSGHPGERAFTVDGFESWKKVRAGEECAFLIHMGKDSHHMAVSSCADLMKQSQHIDKAFVKLSSQQIAENRLRVRTSVIAVRFLAFQGCAFRGHDERPGSLNPANFLKLLELLALYNEDVARVLNTGPQNAKYTSPDIQKEIISAFSARVKKAIREDIGDSKFCIMVDESRDESKKEQMAIVLRFVDKEGFIRERFFGLVHVSDTKSLTLQKEIYKVLSNHTLDIQNIRGQSYDGASNMRGEWNGLQALVLKDCPYAYYIHCLAHRLKLALVAAARDDIPVYQFFKKLSDIVNIVGASTKRHDEFQSAQAEEIEYFTSIDELETGRGLNQIGTLQRAGDTRWSSHYKSVTDLRKKYSSVVSTVLGILEGEGSASQKGDADAAYEDLISYEFVFILYLMEEIMLNTNELCKDLQLKSQDILNAMRKVSSTKAALQRLRDDGWDSLIIKVNSHCQIRDIDIPDLNARYVKRRGRARGQQDDLTLRHYYQVDLFYATIDTQLQELNGRFSEHAVELLILSSALDPREMRIAFKIDNVCELVEKFYSSDFAEHEKLQFRKQLEFFGHDVIRDEEFKDLSTISDLSQWLVKTRRSSSYPLVYRLIVLVLTLPVSTATTERAFSAMRIVKTRLRSKMNDDFLTDTLMMYIEREIAEKFTIDSINDDFRDMHGRQVLF